MTNDLISRSKVEEVISALVHEEGVTDDAAVLGCMVWNAVSTMKAVDAAPVVHGRWIKKPFLLGTTNVCDKCGEYYGMPHGMFNYCPNYGAKMDREECMDA